MSEQLTAAQRARARGRARRARGPAPQGRDGGDQDRARVRRPLGELRVPRREERAGPPRSADPSATRSPAARRHRRARDGRPRRSRVDGRDRGRRRGEDGGRDLRGRRRVAGLAARVGADGRRCGRRGLGRGTERRLEGEGARDPPRLELRQELEVRAVLERVVLVVARCRLAARRASRLTSRARTPSSSRQVAPERAVRPGRFAVAKRDDHAPVVASHEVGQLERGRRHARSRCRRLRRGTERAATRDP